METANIKEYLYGLLDTLSGLYESGFGWASNHYIDDKVAAEEFFNTTYRATSGTLRQAVAVLDTICGAITDDEIDIVEPETEPTVWQVSRIHDIALLAGLTEAQAQKLAMTR